MDFIHTLLSNNEIKHDLLRMRGLKALGPNGLHAIFFQSYIVGNY